METIILITLAFVVGYKVSSWIHALSFKKILEDLGVSQRDLERLKDRIENDEDTAEQRSKDKVIVDIKVEQHQGLLFAYEVERDTFIAQGSTADELLERILDKYPVNHRVVCDKSNGGDLIAAAVEKRVKNG